MIGNDHTKCGRTPFWPAEQAEAERRTGQTLVVGHFPNTDRDCPAIGRLIEHPWLHAVAAGYLGAPATILDVRLWWSFASAAPSPAALRLAAQDNSDVRRQGFWA